MAAAIGNLILAIDIGNSSARAGIVDRNTLRCERRCFCPTADAVERLPGHIAVLVGSGTAEPFPLKISCVVPSVRAQLGEELNGIAGIASPLWVQYHRNLPLRFSYDSPSRLGADRIANCLYARAAHAGENVVVIDAGSAITVDCVSAEGVFAGGAIFPGLAMQLAGLHGSAAQLPPLDPSKAPPAFPGSSTEKCMQAGVLYGTVGALRELIRKSENCVGPVSVLTCGGAWPLLSPLVNFPYSFVPELTLVGTALFE